MVNGSSHTCFMCKNQLGFSCISHKDFTKFIQYGFNLQYLYKLWCFDEIERNEREISHLHFLFKYESHIYIYIYIYFFFTY